MVVVMSGFTVHGLESTNDCLNDQESKSLSSVKAREIRHSGFWGPHFCGSWGLHLQGGGYVIGGKYIRCPCPMLAEK